MSLEDLITRWQKTIRDEQLKYPDVAGLPTYFTEMSTLIPELEPFRDRFENLHGVESYDQLSNILTDLTPGSFNQQLKNVQTGGSAITYRPSKTIRRGTTKETLERVFDKQTAERIMRLTGEAGPKPSGTITDRFRADRTASGGYQAPSSLRPPRGAAAGTAYAKPGTMQVDVNAGSVSQPPKYQTPSRDQLNQNLRRRLELYR